MPITETHFKYLNMHFKSGLYNLNLLQPKAFHCKENVDF